MKTTSGGVTGGRTSGTSTPPWAAILFTVYTTAPTTTTTSLPVPLSPSPRVTNHHQQCPLYLPAQVSLPYCVKPSPGPSPPAYLTCHGLKHNRLPAWVRASQTLIIIISHHSTPQQGKYPGSLDSAAIMIRKLS